MEQRVSEDPEAPGNIHLHRAGIIEGEPPGQSQIILQPRPSDDPNEPLNWSKKRKAINYAIICFYALMTFTILDIGTVAWQNYVNEFGMTWAELNITYACNTAGLAFGCIIFIPFAQKYGKRPVYIISTLITFGMSIWQATLQSFGEMAATQVISGLSGAVSETLVQMTVIDMFFVHDRGTMNGVYLLMVAIGSFLAPVASGGIAVAQGWRWMYWWTSILLGINLLLFVFFYEETKFVPRDEAVISNNDSTRSNSHSLERESGEKVKESLPTTLTHSRPKINTNIPMKSRRERLAFVTTSEAPFSKLLRHAWYPFVVLVTIPAIAYCALQYGMLLSWFSVIITSEAQFFILPPYNFDEVGIGLLCMPAFIGCIFGFLWGGPFSDWSIVWFTRRNRGIYEPEMRLYGAILPAIVGPIGLFLYGYSTAAGAPWIIPCIGIGLFGFVVISMGDISLTYLSDSYPEILATGLIGLAFVRNVMATIVVFVQDPWTDGLGLHGMFTCIGCMTIGLNLIIIPGIIWGKRFRIRYADRYRKMAVKQFNARVV
ncbi:hypothetical protein HYALB_00002775 [Hymenoscyphus albidus]|uniref:Major facilitator superfamily (MFS) profile domain-containing protein n=1 Tax=Hymenoscyphus albidus TaxID=595503 RepID=A0A9N9LHI7_9HELO|nr:hypothetical protein HYALB_00002775 [Hymenoscyphus albidus]